MRPDSTDLNTTDFTACQPRALLLCAAIAMSLSLPCSAQKLPWTAVGSTGVGQILLSNAWDGMISVPPRIYYSGAKAMLDVGNAGTFPISAKIRYNVVATPGVFNDPNYPTLGHVLTMSFQNPREGTRVLARLFQVDLANGAVSQRMVLDSVSWPYIFSIQTRSVTQCGFSMNFNLYAYYVEVELQANDRTSTEMPYVEALQIRHACYTPPPPEGR
jgi:hypothetical protein